MTYAVSRCCDIRASGSNRWSGHALRLRIYVLELASNHRDTEWPGVLYPNSGLVRSQWDLLAQFDFTSLFHTCVICVHSCVVMLLLFVYSECIVGDYLCYTSEETSGAATGSTTAPSITSTSPLAWCSSIPCIGRTNNSELANSVSPRSATLNASVVYYTKRTSKLLKLIL